MKLLIPLFGLLLLVMLAMPLLAATVVATNPWLAVGFLLGSITVTQDAPRAPTGVAVGVPADQWAVMQQASQDSACGVSAADLAAMAKTESGFGSNMNTSSAGAVGYLQFLPSTWSAYGQGGNPYDFHDAIPAAARLLCADGYGSNRTHALNSYGGCLSSNCLGSGSYADAIDQVVKSFTPTPAASATSGVLGVALQWLGTPYAWGGNSPGVGLDCSGLVQQAFAALGIHLPRTSEQQYAATQHVSANQVQPGDLVFFDTDGPGATHVGLVTAPGQMVDAPDVGLTVRTEAYTTPYWASHIVGFGRVSS